MRRDVGYYVNAPLQQTFQAFLDAATHSPFERDCNVEPFHTIGFGVNYSFKYNMNGGSCTIHFMPQGPGTAVNMRFSIAQLVGARYESYAEDLVNAMRRYLPAPVQKAEYDVDMFLLPQNQVTPATVQQLQAPVQPAPVPAPAPTPAAPAAGVFCANCGTQLAADARFCTKCGKPVSAPNQNCPGCGAPKKPGDAFCSQCGTRLG